MKNAAMNTSVQISLHIPAFNPVGYVELPEVELLDHMVIVFLIF